MNSVPEYMYIPHSKPSLSEHDFLALKEVMDTKMIAEGETVREFEESMSEYLNLSGGVATSSGTSALFLALKSLNVRKGDEVIIPTYVCRSVWDAVKQTGATPILCDIGNDWCVNHDTIEPLITKRTKAIIPVHIFGIAVDIGPICEFGVPVIEDCCQALGLKINNQMVGSFGDLCILSFHATKLLTTGEGGMILAKDDSSIKKINQLKHGQSSHMKVRYRYPLSDLQAAIGLSQLSRYNEFLKKRRTIANIYFESLKKYKCMLPSSIYNKSIFFRFPLIVKQNIDVLISLFNEKGVQVRRGVDALLHNQLKIQKYKYSKSENAFQQTLCIPIYPSLSRIEINFIINLCQMIFDNRDYYE